MRKPPQTCCPSSCSEAMYGFRWGLASEPLRIRPRGCPAGERLGWLRGTGQCHCYGPLPGSLDPSLWAAPAPAAGGGRILGAGQAPPCPVTALGCRGGHSPFTGAQSSSSRARTRMGAGLGPMAAEPGDASARLGMCRSFGVRGSCRVDAAHPGLGLGLAFMSSLGRWGGRKGGGAEGMGGFPQRGLNVLKYSAYKRGQEFPAQTVREEETARPSCRPWHPPPGISAPGFLMSRKFRLLAKEGSGRISPCPLWGPARPGASPWWALGASSGVPRDTNPSRHRGVPAGLGAAVMGAVIAATAAVSGMPVAVAARSPLPFSPVPLSGATASAPSRSRRVPGASHRAPKSRCPLPSPGWPPWLPTAGSGRAPDSAEGPSRVPGDTPQGAGAHPLLLSLLHELLQLRAAAFPLSGCTDPSWPRALTLRPPKPMDPRSTGGRTTGGEGAAPGVPGGSGSPLQRWLRLPAVPTCWWHMVGTGRSTQGGGVRECGRVWAQTRDFPQGEKLNRSFQ